MKLYFLFSALFLFLSCTDLKKPKQLDRVEALNTKFSELEQLYSNFAEFSDIQLEVSEVESRLIEYSTGDTLTFEFAQKIDRYSSISSDLEWIETQIPHIDSLFEIRGNGILTLSHDIENGVGDRSKYDDNIEFENTSMTELSGCIEYCDSMLKNAILNFKELNHQVEEYSLDLEKKTRNNN